MTRVLGIEGTAWAASAAVFDTSDDRLVVETDGYVPESGGIHPREAAEHMQEAIPRVIRRVREREPGRVDAVAFSQGPGLGPCLRVCGTAARALALDAGVPLVGVNHMVAHLEIGRYYAGFGSPVCLNASGANAHLLGYQEGRYRVLGETMDTGVGNAIDKVARHFGWSHPGGPKVEDAAREGSYVSLPYVVKGMDFSFSGIVSAAKHHYDEGVAVADVCCGLQETVFAMLTEVSERALSLTGSDELVLGGGVGHNQRLQAMLGRMCDDRGARLFVPDAAYLGDNAGMIAVLGALMFEAGATVPVAESGVRPDYRPEEVEVVWRGDESVARPPVEGSRVVGAEAVVELDGDMVRKERVRKPYRHEGLDERLRRERTAAEARLTHLARREGVPTPVVKDVDPVSGVIVFERVGRVDLAAAFTREGVRDVGRWLARLHAAGLVHGDPTPRNVRVDGRTYLIDFGLGYHSEDVEDFAMDLHVFRQSLDGTAEDAEVLRTAVVAAYEEAGEARVVDRLREIERRGRYQPGLGE